MLALETKLGPSQLDARTDHATVTGPELGLSVAVAAAVANGGRDPARLRPPHPRVVARLCAPMRGSALIGAAGFEPATSPTRTVRATRLRHAPRRPILPDDLGGVRHGGVDLRPRW